MDEEGLTPMTTTEDGDGRVTSKRDDEHGCEFAHGGILLHQVVGNGFREGQTSNVEAGGRAPVIDLSALLSPPRSRGERSRDAILRVLDGLTFRILNLVVLFLVVVDGAFFFFLLIGAHGMCTHKNFKNFQARHCEQHHNEQNALPATSSCLEIINQEQHDRAMEIENAAKVILKEAAEGRLRQTFDDRATISSAFNHLFAESLPPPDALNVCHYARELIQVEGTTPGEPIRFPTIGTNGFITGAPRRMSAEGTIQARVSRAANVAKHVMTEGGRAITLEGTSANHPEMNAAENMAALAACIRAAICDIDHKYPGSIKSCVAVVELSNGVCQNRADAHGALVIHGDDQLLSIAEDFQSFLIQRGAMNRAMHETDGTQVVIVCGVDRIHRFYEWMRYCTKAESNQSDAYVQRLEEALQDAGINIVGNSLDNLFILHKKRAVIE